MAVHIAFAGPERIIEASSLTLALTCAQDSTPTAPASVKYRLDDPDSGCSKIAWASATPAPTITLTIPAAANICTSCKPVERRELTVMIDEGLATQRVERYCYEVENIRAIA